MLWAVLAVCAAPVIASYFTYYVLKPSARNNYGTLIDPRQYPIPDLGSRTLDGKPAGLKDFAGKWLLVKADGGACPQRCQEQLYFMRQERLMQGKEMDRVERVWLVTDDAPIEPLLLKQLEGMRVLRVDPARLAAWLPLETGMHLPEHVFMIDPLGNLMMRWPKDPDPKKVSKDIGKVLKASGIG
ncbi:cytochrome C oxidase subunit I [Massilia sp. TS11]|uniref:SCO family protein n=1 Tax=Massilia sp. TS11 TaxID=2908003 RepID=UPI001EDAE08D|nr:cytochrome C oxidase subunit I [Massilia sp. TS11]MCG2585356.1 cytochrome C oxidase subunit I [Massilia sp. TS11]